MRALRWTSGALGAGPLALTLLFAGCSVDSRELLGDTSDSGGSGSAGGSGGSGGSAGEAGEGDAPSAGTGAGGGGGNAGSGTAGSAAGSGAAGSAAAGSGGATVCPDLDGNGTPDCQESLVKDPSFDSSASLSDWLPDLNTSRSWDAQDAEARAMSGSLGVQNTTSASLDGLTMGGSRQCVPATAGVSYTFYTNVFVAGDQGSAGAGGVNMSFFASADCTGDALYGKTSNLPQTLDAWAVVHMDSVAPSYTNSMSVRLVSVKTFAAQPLTVLFDDVLVKALPPPMVP